MTTIVTVTTSLKPASVWGMALKNHSHVKDAEWLALGTVAPGCTADFVAHDGQELFIREMPANVGRANAQPEGEQA